MTDSDATPKLLTLSFVEDSTAPALDEAQQWAYWHERGLRELRYRLSFPEGLPAEAALAEMVPARDAGDVCGICGQIVDWFEHLPPIDASSAVRCFAKVVALDAHSVKV